MPAMTEPRCGRRNDRTAKESDVDAMEPVVSTGERRACTPDRRPGFAAVPARMAQPGAADDAATQAA